MHTHPLNFISFNAGPSYISPKTIRLMHEIIDSHFLSVSHRSDYFSEVSEKAIEGMRKQLKIPPDYSIFYQNSSTMAWETALLNLAQCPPTHFVCGEFSRRFYQTSVALGLKPYLIETPSGNPVDFTNAQVQKDSEVITITHNETLSGLMWTEESMRHIRTVYPDCFIIVDVCSSFAGMPMDWSLGDIWLGSVQKCLGMPSGYAYLIASPRAIERSMQLKNNVPEYQSFKAMHKFMKNYQTFETPNSFAIALLARLMEDWDIEAIGKETRRKADLLYTTPMDWKPFVKDPVWRSPTSTLFLVDDAEKWHRKAESKGYILGRTSGEMAKHSFRICCYPSHTYEMVVDLLNTLSTP